MSLQNSLQSTWNSCRRIFSRSYQVISNRKVTYMDLQILVVNGHVLLTSPFNSQTCKILLYINANHIICTLQVSFLPLNVNKSKLKWVSTSPSLKCLDWVWLYAEFPSWFLRPSASYLGKRRNSALGTWAGRAWSWELHFKKFCISQTGNNLD